MTGLPLASAQCHAASSIRQLWDLTHLAMERPSGGSLDHVVGYRHELVALNVLAPTPWWCLRPFDPLEDVQHVQSMGGWIGRLITDTACGRLGGDGVPQ